MACELATTLAAELLLRNANLSKIITDAVGRINNANRAIENGSGIAVQSAKKTLAESTADIERLAALASFD